MGRHVEAEKQRYSAERDRHAEKQPAGADQRRVMAQQAGIDREIERIDQGRRDCPQQAARIDHAAAQPRQCDQCRAAEDHRDAQYGHRPDRLLHDEPVEREGDGRVGVKQQDRDAGLQGLQALPEAQGLRGAEGRSQQNDAPAAATQYPAQIELHEERRCGERHDREIVAPEQHRGRAEPVGVKPPRQQRHEPDHRAARQRGDRRWPVRGGAADQCDIARSSVRCHWPLANAAASQPSI